METPLVTVIIAASLLTSAFQVSAVTAGPSYVAEAPVRDVELTTSIVGESSPYVVFSVVDRPAQHWLFSLYDLVGKGQIDAAIDLAFETFDGMFRRSEFESCDAILRAIDFGELDLDVVVALLAASLPAAKELTSRAMFVQRAETWMRATVPTRVDKILAKLR